MHALRSGTPRGISAILRPALLAGLIVLAGSVSPALAAPTASGQTQATIASVRAATAAFHDLATAEAAGYGLFYHCTDQPGQGAMGQHFVNGALLGTLDPLKPQALVYEPLPGGGYRLVAVEYVVFADGWDAAHDAPPSLFGQTFGLVGSPNRYGLPPFYELHVWLWKPNPSGMFYEWNPQVSCPAA